MEVSVSRSKDPSPWSHKYFKTVKLQNLDQLATVITTYPWSPIIWAGGSRKQTNFISCNFLALDFDDGIWSLADAEKWLKENQLTGIIGTTKSHQLEKKQDSGASLPPCDRFRLVTIFDEKITDKKKYIYNMAQLMRSVPVDKACKDAARLFQPCKHITFHNKGAYYPTQERPKHMDKIEREALTDRLVSGLLPAPVIHYLNQGPRVGERNSAAYYCAINMAKSGHSEGTILKEISKKNTLKLEELKTTVNNAVQAARSEIAEALARLNTNDDDGWDNV